MSELLKLSNDQKKAIDHVIDATVGDIDRRWAAKEESGRPTWLVGLMVLKEVLEAVEDLDTLGIKGAAKKEIAETIVEAIVDEKNIKIKVFGIGIPFSNKVIKKYIMKYASKIIDWLVDTLFNKDKKKDGE